MVAFNAVHNFCFQLPGDELRRRGLPRFDDWRATESAYLDWYDGAISPHLPQGRAYYAAQLELMDAQVGAILEHLDRLGLAENTIVVYTTDNGGSTCNFGTNTPLRGTKYTPWEGGIRVPYLVRWQAGEISGGATRNGLVSTLDLTPTLLAACGASEGAWADSDGRNQLGLLRGETQLGAEILHWDCGWQWATREGPWKAIWADPESRIATGIRRVEHVEPGRGLGLYHLDDDIGETNNLADQHPNTVEHLIARHRAWRSTVGLDPAR